MNIRAVIVAALLLAATSVSVYGVDIGAPTPTLEAAREDIAAQRWDDPVEKLRLIVDANTTNADAYSLLGYALRHTGAHPRAMQAYDRALTIAPDHTGALEYQGELFVVMGDVEKAKANLARLAEICGTGCEEYLDLDAAIKTGAPKPAPSWG